jgi:hypothetical protein
MKEVVVVHQLNHMLNKLIVNLLLVFLVMIVQSFLNYNDLMKMMMSQVNEMFSYDVVAVEYYHQHYQSIDEYLQQLL